MMASTLDALDKNEDPPSMDEQEGAFDAADTDVANQLVLALAEPSHLHPSRYEQVLFAITCSFLCMTPSGPVAVSAFSSFCALLGTVIMNRINGDRT